MKEYCPLLTKTNFFEKRVTEYQLAENVENSNIDFSSDF